MMNQTLRQRIRTIDVEEGLFFSREAGMEMQLNVSQSLMFSPRVKEAQ